jgi:hypothetical protein
MNKKIVWGVVAAVVIAGGSFYGGSVYGQGQAAATASAARTSAFAGRTGRAGAGGGFTSGTVVSANSTSMTVQLQSGSTQIVLLSPSTPIQKTTTGSMSDLAAGTTVVVTGTANSDGSLTAQSVQIRPAGSTMPAAATPATTPAGQ